MEISKQFLTEQAETAEMGFGHDVIERLVNAGCEVRISSLRVGSGFYIGLFHPGLGTTFVGMGPTVSLAIAQAVNIIVKHY